MQTHRRAHALSPHPAHPPLAVRAVQARVLGAEGAWLLLRWRIEGAGRLVVLPFAGKERADGLWRTTCFELFLRPEGGTSYAEFNLSPSERWAAYDFDAPRQNMRNRPVPRQPVCTLRRGGSVAIFDAAIPLAALPPGRCAMSLTAVVEETAGGGMDAPSSGGTGGGAAGQPDGDHRSTGAGESGTLEAGQSIDAGMSNDGGTARRSLDDDPSVRGPEAAGDRSRPGKGDRVDHVSEPWPAGVPATRKSYWALAHPPGAPDFHDPACFAASLAPPDPL